MVVMYLRLADIGLYLYVFVLILIGGILVVTAYKMRSRRKWIIGVGLVVLVILSIGLVPFWAYVLIGAGWPGSYIYVERRSFDTPEEAASLLVAETFDYALLPVSETTNLSDSSFYRGVLEYSLEPVGGAKFLSNDTLSEYAIINHTFNPFLTLGRRAISYVANCTHFSTLSVQLNAALVESNSHWAVVFTANNDTILETLETKPFYGNVFSFWRGGYWNGTGYTGFEFVRDGDYIGPTLLWLNYTDVFFVDLRLTIDRTGAGSFGWGDGFGFYQRVVVDQSGRVLFVSYHDRYYARMM